MGTTYHKNEPSFVADSKDARPQPVCGPEILLNTVRNLFTHSALPQDGFPVREVMLVVTWTKLLEAGVDWVVAGLPSGLA
ncbi:hypothetical protein PQX77_019269 [Marasmius sp. AFHP31]|nr:hypothetical protein PQX77_019269 [Marasmius sp. AFHP31]